MGIERLYDEIAAGYDALFQKPEHVVEESALFNRLKVRGKVLDIGCGTGLLLRYKFIHPKDYLGVDPSEGMLKVFRGENPYHMTFCLKFEDFISPCKFDTIISLFASVNYIRPDILARRIPLLLNPGGVAYLMYAKAGYRPALHDMVDGVSFDWYDPPDREPEFTVGEKYEIHKIVGG